MDNQPGSFCGRDCFFGPLQQRKPPDGSMSVICLPPEKIGQHVVMGIDRQLSVLATCSLAVMRFGRESVGFARDEQRPGLYREFARDFFDLIIIVDECHRGSARDESNWREISKSGQAAIIRRNHAPSYAGTQPYCVLLGMRAPDCLYIRCIFSM
jgi:hypothetical protein